MGNVWWPNSVTPFGFSLKSFLFVQLDIHELYFIYSVLISIQEVKFGRIGWKYDLIKNVWKIKIQNMTKFRHGDKTSPCTETQFRQGAFISSPAECEVNHIHNMNNYNSLVTKKKGASLKESDFAFILSCALNSGVGTKKVIFSTKYYRQAIVHSRRRNMYFVTRWCYITLSSCVQYRVKFDRGMTRLKRLTCIYPALAMFVELRTNNRNHQQCSLSPVDKTGTICLASRSDAN